MVDTNYKKLYNHIAEHLIDKKRKNEKNILDRLTLNLEKKIKNALIDNRKYVILYDDNYNETINNILPKLKNLVNPFNITYRKKTNKEISFIENIYDKPPYILIIDWYDYYNISLENKFYNLSSKYIKYKYNKKNNIEYNNNNDNDNYNEHNKYSEISLIDNTMNVQSDDSESTNNSFDLVHNI